MMKHTCTGLLLAIALLAVALGCGKKASPVPPLAWELPRAVGLSARLTGTTVVLTWQIPDTLNVPTAYHVVRARIKPGGCTGCPLDFVPMGKTIPGFEKWQGGKTLVFEDYVKKSGLYIYRVIGVFAHGRKDKGSEKAAVTVP